MKRQLLAFQLTQLEKLAAQFRRDTGISLEMMRSDRRHAAISWPRQRFMLLLRRARPAWSLKDIAIALHRRHHTTVMYGIACAKARELLGAAEAV